MVYKQVTVNFVKSKPDIQPPESNVYSFIEHAHSVYYSHDNKASLCCSVQLRNTQFQTAALIVPSIFTGVKIVICDVAACYRLTSERTISIVDTLCIKFRAIRGASTRENGAFKRD